MALSRRPARFKRPAFMQTKAISQEQLELLRAAAASVYVDKQNPKDDESSVVKTAGTGSAKGKEEPGIDTGVQLLAAAAIKYKKELEQNKF